MFIASATVVDQRRTTALTRALGATPSDVLAGLTASQLFPVLIGAVLGVPGGLALLAGVSDETTTVPVWQLVAVVFVSVAVIVGLVAIPACVGTRRAVWDTLRSELA